MFDEDLKDDAMAERPLPYLLPAGPSRILRRSDLPAELANVASTLARMEDSADWFDSDADKLQKLLWVAVRALNMNWSDRPIEVACAIYEAYRGLVSEQERALFIQDLLLLVARGDCDPDAIQLPLWLEDTTELIAMASAAYVNACGRVWGDPLPAAEHLIEDSEDDIPERMAGVFRGLLTVGHPEILELLRPLRYQLTDEELGMVFDRRLVAPFDTTMMFLLEWLEEAQAGADHGKFTLLASAITPTDREIASEAPATDGQPLLDTDDGMPDHWYFPIDRRSMGRFLSPRLRALARGENDTRVMPAVLQAFDIDGDGEAT